MNMRVVAFLVVGFGAGCADRSSATLFPALRSCPSGGPKANIKVASFNIRAGLSSSLGDVAEVIRALDADVVALQEVDVGVARTHRVNQPQALAERLGYEYAFAGAIKREGGDYGVALLSRLPFADVRRVDLKASGAFEPRVAIDADVCAGSLPVTVVAVHADVFGWSASKNAQDLSAALASRAGRGLIVAGDLNAEPGDEAPRHFARLGLVDLLRRDEGPTYVETPARRLDYIFADTDLAERASVRRVDVRVSDHIPVLASIPLGER